MFTHASREQREALEDELRAATREWETAQELTEEGTRLFQRVQDTTHEYATRHDVFSGEVRHVLGRNEHVFIETKQEATRRLDAFEERAGELRRALADTE